MAKKSNVFKGGKKALSLKMRRIAMLGLLAVGSLIYAASCSTIGLGERPFGYERPSHRSDTIEIRLSEKPGIDSDAMAETADIVKTALKKLEKESPWTIKKMLDLGMHISLEDIDPNIHGYFNVANPDKITINCNSNPIRAHRNKEFYNKDYITQHMMSLVSHELCHALQNENGTSAEVDRILPSNGMLLQHYKEVEAFIVGAMCANTFNAKKLTSTRADRDKYLLEYCQYSWMEHNYNYGFLNYARIALVKDRSLDMNVLTRDIVKIAKQGSATSTPYGDNCFSEQAIAEAIQILKGRITENIAKRLSLMDDEAMQAAQACTEPLRAVPALALESGR